MTNFFYQLYFLKFKSSALEKWQKKVIIRLSNYLFPVLFKVSGFLKKKTVPRGEKSKPEVIISLTTFPARINKVWLTIETILRQKEKPDKVLLWLYKGEFNGKESLPKNLLRLEKRGLEIRFCDENLMPHKKYFYTMQEYPDANIITVDDDMFYPPDLTEKLLKYHKKNPKSIICTISRQITVKDSKLTPYHEWGYLKTNTKPEFTNLPIGVGGVLYPSGSIDKIVLDIEKLKKIALKADDLWLKIMSLKSKTKVISVAGEYPGFFIPIIQKNNQRLMDSNIGEGQNDAIFKELLKHYQIPVSFFEKSDLEL